MEVDGMLEFEMQEDKDVKPYKVESESGITLDVSPKDIDSPKQDPSGNAPTKPFQCTLCPSSYANKRRLGVHMKKKHPINHNNHKQGKKNPTQDEETFIQCPLCAQSFTSHKPTNFMNHLQDKIATNNNFAQDKSGKCHCPLCPKFFKSKDGLFLHIINIHVEHKPHECQICKSENKCRNFIDQKSLLKHTEHVHVPPRFKCEICFMTFKYSSTLKQHKDIHTTALETQYQYCSKTLSIRSLKHHLVVFHNDKNLKMKTYTCELCGKICYRLRLLEKHVAKAHVVDKSVKCEVCGKMLVNESDLALHLKTHQEKPKGFRCDVCFKEISRRHIFVRHLAVEHERFFDCRKCSRSFKTKTDFDRHSIIITDSELQCHICHVFLQSPCSFGIHIKSHEKQSGFKTQEVKVKKETSPAPAGAGIKTPHDSKSKLSKKPFKWQCKSCSKTFKGRLQLMRHETTHSLDRPWECDVCQKTFKSRRDLADHKRIHEEVKQHKCLICQKSFVFPTRLKLHMANYHGGEKPFKCHLCDATWALKQQLERHLISHSTERPFSCNKCPKKFKSSIDARRHERRVHKKATMTQETLGCNRGTIKLENQTFVCNFFDFETQDHKEVAEHNNQHGIPIPRVLLSKNLPCPSDYRKTSNTSPSLITPRL